jgi:hypothetical protein
VRDKSASAGQPMADCPRRPPLPRLPAAATAGLRASQDALWLCAGAPPRERPGRGRLQMFLGGGGEGRGGTEAMTQCLRWAKLSPSRLGQCSWVNGQLHGGVLPALSPAAACAQMPDPWAHGLRAKVFCCFQVRDCGVGRQALASAAWAASLALRRF